MAKFEFTIDVEPKDIPKLDDVHKHDCASSLLKIINAGFKYTLIFSMAVAAFFGIYTLICFWWFLRMSTFLPQIPPAVPFIALAIAAMEFVSGSMKKWALALEVVLHTALIFFSVQHIPTLVIVPFALYGIYVHIKLFTLVPVFSVISSLPGYPDFMPPLSKDMLSTVHSDENKKETVSPENTEETDTKNDKKTEDSVQDNAENADGEKNTKDK